MKLLPRTSAAVLGAALLAACAFACSGHAGSTCHSNGDCAHGFFCAAPNGGPSCGIPPQQDCQATSSCPAMEVCHSVHDQCSSTGLGSMCGPPCGACGTGLRCNAQGACEPIPCDQGFACAIWQRCDPAAAHAAVPVYDLTHGCDSVPCAADSGCPATTACVNGACQSGPGQCEQPMLVP